MQFWIILLLAIGAWADEICSPPCGCFSDDPPFHQRPLPETWEVQEIQWLLYTNDNRDIAQNILIDEDGIAELPDVFNPAFPTKYLIHGWNGSPGSPSSPGSLTFMKNVFIDDPTDYNVVVIDWSTGANKPLYLPAASNTRVVGACTGFIASQIQDLSLAHCIGHSLGGQTCGYMGNSLDGELDRATGLDPAGPGFDPDENTDPDLRLDASDAHFVDTINTNAGALGLGKHIGHVDYFPHKGGRQPGCDNGSCDHSICRNYFTNSISGELGCYGRLCATEDDADNGLCDASDCTDSDPECNKMGLFADRTRNGTYYNEMSATEPWCLN